VEQLQGTGVGSSPDTGDETTASDSGGETQQQDQGTTTDRTDSTQQPRNDTSDSGTGVQVVSSNTSNQGLEQGQFDNLEETEKTKQAQRFEQEVIDSTRGVDSEEDVRIVQEDGQLQAELTVQGDRSIEAFQRQQAERFAAGTSGVAPLAEDSARNRIKDEVANAENVDPSEVLVQFDDGEASVSLTEEGQKQAQGLEAVAPQGGRRQIQEESIQQRLAAGAGGAVSTDEVETGFSDGYFEASIQPTGGVTEIADPQGGRREIQEDSAENRIADAAGEAVSGDEVEVELSDTDASVSIFEPVRTTADVGGGRRQIQREQLKQRVARQNAGVDANDLLVKIDEDGARFQLNDAAKAERIREKTAEKYAVIQEDEVTVDFDATGDPQVGLTEEGKRDRVKQEVSSERENVEWSDVEVSFDDKGNPEVTLDERFGDDGGRLLGIGGLEDDVSAAAGVFDEFAAGVGEGVGQFAKPLDWAAQPFAQDDTDDGRLGEFAEGVGAGLMTGVTLGTYSGNVDQPFESAVSAGTTGAASLLNIPGHLATLDEAGEFIGYSLSETAQGRGGQFAEATEAAAAYKVGQMQKVFNNNPVSTAAMVGGSLVGSYGIIRAASASSATAGRAAAWAIQPGEELVTAGATRALATTSRGSRAVDALPGGKIDIEEAALLGAQKGLGAGKRASSRVGRRLGLDRGRGSDGILDGTAARLQGARERVPDVTVESDPSAGVLEVDPELRAQIYDSTVGNAATGIRTIRETSARDVAGGTRRTVGRASSEVGQQVDNLLSGVQREYVSSRFKLAEAGDRARRGMESEEGSSSLDMSDVSQGVRRELTSARFGLAETGDRARLGMKADPDSSAFDLSVGMSDVSQGLRRELTSARFGLAETGERARLGMQADRARSLLNVEDVTQTAQREVTSLRFGVAERRARVAGGLGDLRTATTRTLSDPPSPREVFPTRSDIDVDAGDVTDAARREFESLRFGVSERASQARSGLQDVRDLTIRVGDTEAETLFDSELDEPTIRSQVDDPLDVGGDTTIETETSDDSLNMPRGEADAASGEAEVSNQESVFETEPRRYEPEYTGETSGYTPLEATSPDAEDSLPGEWDATPATDGELDVGRGTSGVFETSLTENVETAQTRTVETEVDIADGVDSTVWEPRKTAVETDVRTEPWVESGIDTGIRVDTSADVRTRVDIDTDLDLRQEYRVDTKVEPEGDMRDYEFGVRRGRSGGFDSVSEQWDTGFEEAEDAFDDLFGG
jgi:hypothetical protein